MGCAPCFLISTKIASVRINEIRITPLPSIPEIALDKLLLKRPLTKNPIKGNIGTSVISVLIMQNSCLILVNFYFNSAITRWQP